MTDEIISVENSLRPKFDALVTARNELYEQLKELAGGKELKGDEVVGWLGEVYGKIRLGGRLVNDSEGFEHDLLTEDGKRVSIKARKGRTWQQSSAIPKIEGEGCPTHLLFMRFSNDYRVHTIWLHDWQKLRNEGRFKAHKVRGEHRSYIFRAKVGHDREAIIYPPAE